MPELKDTQVVENKNQINTQVKVAEPVDSQNTMVSILPGTKISLMVQNIKQYLIVQPKPNATAVAKASVFPLLYSLKQDIWDPRCLKQIETKESYVRHQLKLADGKVSIDSWEVGQNFKRAPARAILPEGGPWGIRTNGSNWEFVIFDDDFSEENVFSFSLYGDSFHEIIFQLFSPNKDSLERRLLLGKSLLLEDLLRKKLYRLANTFGIEEVQNKDFEGILQMLTDAGLLTSQEHKLFTTEKMQKVLNGYTEALRQGYLRIMKPLSQITLEDVQHHCRVVENLKGGLKTSFDDSALSVSSRSGFYYVLSAIAVQFGRSDAISAEDLIRPPEEPPKDSRSRPLGKPGWYLVLSNPTGIESATANLLDKLNLNQRFKTTYNGLPFPNDPLSL